MKLLLFLTFALINEFDTADHTANNEFAAATYEGLLQDHSGNLLVCTTSVDTAVWLAFSSDGGITAKNLDTGLHYPNDKEIIKERIQNDTFPFSGANKIYVNDGYKVSDKFKHIAEEEYEADIESVNFEKTDKAAATMNNWAEKQTNGKIQDLINKDSLNGDIRAVFINVIYFHGQWIRGFPADATIPHPFYSLNGKEIEVQMMQQLNELNYYECFKTEAKYVELPFEGDEVTMTIVLPNDKNGLSTLEAQLYQVLREHKYTKQSVELKLPKFETKSSTEIPKSSGAYLNTIIIAGIEVDEEGTVASAATAAMEPIERSSASYKRPQVFRFVADHPFMYYIAIKKYIIFVGRYTGGV